MAGKQTIFDYMAAHLRERPEHVVYLFEDREITFRDVDKASAKLRGASKSMGIGKGDRVAILMSDCPEYIFASLAIMGLGGIAVMCSTMTQAKDVAYVLSDSGAKIAFCTSDLADKLSEAVSLASNSPGMVVVGKGSASQKSFEQLLDEGVPTAPISLEGEAEAFLLYTSGSTGAPKGAVHRHRDIPCIIEGMGTDVYEMTPEDRLFSSSRLFFAYGFGNSFGFPLGIGITAILCSERPTPPVIGSIFKKYEPTIFLGVPAAFRGVLEWCREGNKLNSSKLKFSASGGENLPAQVYQAWKELTGTPILETIGTTELLHGFISNTKTKQVPGSSGIAVKGYEIKLIDEKGAVYTGAGRGDLYVRGCSAITHYWNKPDKTKEMIIDGWIKTGDVYRRDEEGYFYFEGRADDLFKSSGMWVVPSEIEDVLCLHPAVLEAAVIAEKGADDVNVICAFVGLRSKYEPDDQLAAELIEFAASRLPRFKRPNKIRFMSSLPRTATGKVQRYVLRSSSNQ